MVRSTSRISLPRLLRLWLRATWTNCWTTSNTRRRAERAHPTDEHYLPLFIALGAAGEYYEIRVVEGGVTYGVLAMDSYLFTSAGGLPPESWTVLARRLSPVFYGAQAV